MVVIPAAGTLPWRKRRGLLEVLLVHRPRYDDWSWAKGKLDPGEDWPVAAVRETQEETGLEVRLGRPLPGATYPVQDRSGQRSTKHVRYWAAEVTGGTGELENEVDVVTWLDADTALGRLDYPRDRDQLEALAKADATGSLTTWPIALVRHARARSRSSWPDEDALRPLDKRGLAQAGALVPLLAAFGVSRLLTSGSIRCADTLRPYAAALGLPLLAKEGLSEEGYAAHPDRAVHHLRRLVERGASAAVCTHGDVLPVLLETLRGQVDAATEEGAAADGTLREAVVQSMAKGEVLVAHLAGTGDASRVVAVERHRS